MEIKRIENGHEVIRKGDGVVIARFLGAGSKRRALMRVRGVGVVR